jgi:hypothetical protein
VGLVREGGVGEFGGSIVRDQRRERVVGGGALEGGVEDGDDVVDAAHAAAVAELLGRGEAPWDFPVVGLLAIGGFYELEVGGESELTIADLQRGVQRV